MASPTPSWKRVRELFRQALELPAEHREEFLKDVPEDGGLRREVRSLLEAHQRSEGFLEPSEETEVLRKAPEDPLEPPPTPQPSSAGDLDAGSSNAGNSNAGNSNAGSSNSGEPDKGDPDVGDPLEGRLLGAYRLVHRLESGGMGSVYLAVRADDEYQQRVAVKVLREGRVSDELIARFRNERQILAALDHPRVAKLLDGGTTREGLPYLVMEYIEGEPIDKYCKRRRLTVDQRIELFQEVCSAVRFAHQNLVIHRDLKPKNILITPAGAPKLLDFGIAKLLNPELSAASPVATSKIRLLTPEYASPEQILGRPVSTAADVYSLGVLLYLLLTGRSPYGAPAASPVALAHWIAAVEVPKPSERVQRSESRDTEVIPSTRARSTRRPQREEVQRRKLSRKLRGDLDTIVLKALAKEPRERYASVETLSDDLQRTFDHRPVLARPRTPLYRFARFLRRNRLAAAVVAAFVAAVLSFGSIMALERARAERARQEAEEVTDFLVGLFDTFDPERGLGGGLSASLLLDQGVRTIGRGFRDQPAVLAKLLTSIGVAYLHLGAYPEALPLLQEAYDQRRSDARFPAVERADGAFQLGRLQELRGKAAEAQLLLEEALRLHEQELGGAHPFVGRDLRHLARARYLLGRENEAEELARRSIEILQGAGPGYLGDLLESFNALATFLRNQRRLEEAEEIYRRALARAEASPLAGSPKQLALLGNLANLLVQTGRSDEAEAIYLRARRATEELLSAGHPQLGVALGNLANFYKRQGRDSEARPLYLSALEIFETALPDGHRYQVMGHLSLGDLALTAGRLDEAEEHYLQAERRTRAGSESSSLRVYVELGLAQADQLRGRFAAADGHYRASLELAEASDPATESIVLGEYAALLDLLGRGEEADRRRRRLEEIRRSP